MSHEHVKFDCKSKLTSEEFIVSKNTLYLTKPSDEELRITFNLLVKSATHDGKAIDEDDVPRLIEFMIRSFRAERNIPRKQRMFYCAEWIDEFMK